MSKHPFLCRADYVDIALETWQSHTGSTNYWSLGYSRSWKCFFFFSMFGFPERSARDCSHWTLPCILRNAHHQPRGSQNYMYPRKQLHLHWVKGFIRFLSLESTRIWKKRYDQKANEKPNPTLYPNNKANGRFKILVSLLYFLELNEKESFWQNTKMTMLTFRFFSFIK